MKISRFKYFLDDYSWLLKSVIVIALLLWAMQGHFLIQYMYQDIKNQIPRNLELERDLNKVLISFLKEMIEDAKLKGEKYGPGDYFNDLKRFKIKKYEIGNGYDYEPIFSNSEIARLQDCFISNTGDDRPFSYKDLDNARSRYSEWADRGDVCGDKFHSEIDNKIKKEGFLKTIVFPGLQWAWIGYCRGFFLVFLLFFIRMATRRGIIEIILADKKRFFFAIFLWPIFLLEYPHNVVKEIIVEVELRRIKSVFRSLSDKERMFIRKIATNSDF